MADHIKILPKAWSHTLNTRSISLSCLPVFGSWRMRGAALYFVKKIPPLKSYDGLITSDLMSLSDFKALCGPSCPPSMVYFHENQLTYPLSPGESRDFQFGFTDITISPAADRILFNSQTHFDAFFSKLPVYLNMMPEYQPNGWLMRYAVKPMFSIRDVIFRSRKIFQPIAQEDLPPLIVWNHRWEFDKNPEAFLMLLIRYLNGV